MTPASDSSRQGSSTPVARAARGGTQPFDAVFVAEPGEENLWSWDGRFALAISGYGIFVCQRETYYAYARSATMDDLWAAFGDTGRALARGPHFSPLQLSVRVPQEILLQARSFFVSVEEMHRTEDVLLLYFFPTEKRYELQHPPLRYANVQSVGYEVPPTPPDAVRFGTFHNHPRGVAFHSVEDDEDVRGVPGLHFVFGNLDRPFLTLLCVLSTAAGSLLRVHPYDIFEQPCSYPFPAEWLQRPPKLPRSPRQSLTDEPRKEKSHDS